MPFIRTHISFKKAIILFCFVTIYLTLKIFSRLKFLLESLNVSVRNEMAWVIDQSPELPHGLINEAKNTISLILYNCLICLNYSGHVKADFLFIVNFWRRYKIVSRNRWCHQNCNADPFIWNKYSTTPKLLGIFLFLKQISS